MTGAIAAAQARVDRLAQALPGLRHENAGCDAAFAEAFAAAACSILDGAGPEEYLAVFDQLNRMAEAWGVLGEENRHVLVSAASPAAAALLSP